MRTHLCWTLSLAFVVAASLCLPASAAKKDKTKGLPPASSNNIPDVDDKPMKDAKVKLAQAQGQVERAQDALNKLIAELRKQSEASPQLSCSRLRCGRTLAAAPRRRMRRLPAGAATAVAPCG